MAIKHETVKGRFKEAAGSLTGNKRLKAEGKADQAVGRVKGATDKAVDKVAKTLRD